MSFFIDTMLLSIFCLSIEFELLISKFFILLFSFLGINKNFSPFTSIISGFSKLKFVFGISKKTSLLSLLKESLLLSETLSGIFKLPFFIIFNSFSVIFLGKEIILKSLFDFIITLGSPFIKTTSGLKEVFIDELSAFLISSIFTKFEL